MDEMDGKVEGKEWMKGEERSKGKNGRKDGKVKGKWMKGEERSKGKNG